MSGRVPRGLRRLASRLPVPVLAKAAALAHGETPAQRALRSRVVRDRPTAVGSDTPDDATGVDAAWIDAAWIDAVPFSATDVLTAHLFRVVDALEAEDVPYAVLEAGTLRRRVIVVTADQADRARAALARATDLLVHAVSGERTVGRAVPARALRTDRRLLAARVLRFSHPEPGHRGLLWGPDLGCDVELWPLTSGATATSGVAASPGAVPDAVKLADGTARAPRPNHRVAHLTPDQRIPTRVPVDGRPVSTYEGLLRPHLLDVHFPVDVVYTWVDGSDPAWAERKTRAWDRVHPGSHHRFAANASRFASHDELRYSLRSLEMHAGWVRRVHLVTDAQVPGWLRRDHPRLRVVDHRQIFGADDLPTFNSHAIEARLHHIEGLAEHYLYLNDDVFFGRPVAPETFFLGNGTARFFMTPSTIDLGGPSPGDLPVVSAGKVSRALVEKAFGRTVTHKFQHVAHPQLRSVNHDLEQRFAADLARTAGSPFRSPDDVSVAASLSHYVGFATGRAVPGTLSYRYCDVAERRAPLKLQRLLRHRDADVFCLNEVDTSADAHERAHALARQFLEAYFPLPSSFELTGPPAPRTPEAPPA